MKGGLCLHWCSHHYMACCTKLVRQPAAKGGGQRREKAGGGRGLGTTATSAVRQVRCNKCGASVGERRTCQGRMLAFDRAFAAQQACGLLELLGVWGFVCKSAVCCSIAGLGVQTCFQAVVVQMGNIEGFARGDLPSFMRVRPMPGECLE